MTHFTQDSLERTNKVEKDCGVLLVPARTSQTTDRMMTPPISPHTIQHDKFWRETVLFWNRSDYRWSLIEYLPCLVGLIWDEERLGQLELLSSFPTEAQFYFVKSTDVHSLGFDSHNFYKIFRTRIDHNDMYLRQHARRMSEPEFAGHRHLDPQSITQESFLFCRFLRQVLRATKISCTSLILALKFTQIYKRKSASIMEDKIDLVMGVDNNQFRLFLTSLLLADKYTEDHPYTNKAWSSISGIPMDEVNHMERAFLSVIGHELYLSETDFRNWTIKLQNLCQWNTPNPHHPDNSRNIGSLPFLSNRRHSFSNHPQQLPTPTTTTDDQKNNNNSNSNNSFWSRIKFHLK